jgi:hypothetical protein
MPVCFYSFHMMRIITTIFHHCTSESDEHAYDQRIWPLRRFRDFICQEHLQMNGARRRLRCQNMEVHQDNPLCNISIYSHININTKRFSKWKRGRKQQQRNTKRMTCWSITHTHTRKCSNKLRPSADSANWAFNGSCNGSEQNLSYHIILLFIFNPSHPKQSKTQLVGH